jgi:hypothetical protein
MQNEHKNRSMAPKRHANDYVQHYTVHTTQFSVGNKLVLNTGLRGCYTSVTNFLVAEREGSTPLM